MTLDQEIAKTDAATRPKTMRAIVQDRYGPPEVLRLAEIAEPVPGPDDVLVRVLAASAFIGDWHVVTGLPYVFRLSGAGLRAPKERVRGQDFAGLVVSVGENVTGVQVDEAVFGTCRGSFAELALAEPGRIAPKPSNLTFEAAATVPIAGTTALQAVRKAGVRQGQAVLVLGAAGGVGTFAVQIAKARGAEVTGVCSPAKVELVRSIGADHVIDYTSEDFAPAGKRYDVILDTGGSNALTRLRRALVPDGTLVIVGGEGGGRWFGIGRLLGAPVLSLFVGQRLTPLAAKQGSEDLRVLTELIEAGSVTPVIGATYPLNEVPDAIRVLGEGHGRGKVAIRV